MLVVSVFKNIAMPKTGIINMLKFARNWDDPQPTVIHSL